MVIGSSVKKMNQIVLLRVLVTAIRSVEDITETPSMNYKAAGRMEMVR